MKMHHRTEVTIKGLGKAIYEHDQEYADNSNVFERVYEYRQHIYKTFPNCQYRLLESKLIKERKPNDNQKQ